MGKELGPNSKLTTARPGPRWGVAGWVRGVGAAGAPSYGHRHAGSIDGGRWLPRQHSRPQKNVPGTTGQLCRQPPAAPLSWQAAPGPGTAHPPPPCTHMHTCSWTGHGPAHTQRDTQGHPPTDGPGLGSGVTVTSATRQAGQLVSPGRPQCDHHRSPVAPAICRPPMCVCTCAWVWGGVGGWQVGGGHP